MIKRISGPDAESPKSLQVTWVLAFVAWIFFVLIMLCVGVTLLGVPAQAVELMKWERIPLQVPLNVGQERIVFVDKNVRVGFPPALNDKLRVQSSGGAVYRFVKCGKVTHGMVGRQNQHHGVVIAEVVKSQRASHEIVGFPGLKGERVTT